LTQRLPSQRKWQPPDFAASRIARVRAGLVTMIMLQSPNSLSSTPAPLNSQSASMPLISTRRFSSCSVGSASGMNSLSSIGLAPNALVLKFSHACNRYRHSALCPA